LKRAAGKQKVERHATWLPMMTALYFIWLP